MPMILPGTLVFILACNSPNGQLPISPSPPGEVATILMVGNSLTASWDIPAMVAEFAVQGGANRPTIETAVVGGFGLGDHWDQPATRFLIESHKYDVMIMQQGPSTLDSSREYLVRWSAVLSDAAAGNIGRSGLYVVWPPESGGIDATINNYTTASNTNSLALYPAGQAWREAFRLDDNIPLYGPDHFHPSPTGAMLAAMTIAATVFDQDPTSYTNLMPEQVDNADIPTMRTAVKVAVERYGRR